MNFKSRQVAMRHEKTCKYMNQIKGIQRNGKKWKNMEKQGKTWKNIKKHEKISRHTKRHEKPWKEKVSYVEIDKDYR